MASAGVMGIRGAGRLGKIRDVLSIVGKIRRIDGALTEAEAFRSAVGLVLELAETVGVDWRWTDRLRRILENESIFELVLAIVRYVSGLVESDATDEALHVACVEGWARAEAGPVGDRCGTNASDTFEAAGLMEWLPLVVQILSLIRNIRGEFDGTS